MEEKNLFELNLQRFAEESNNAEETGENDFATAEQSEVDEPTESESEENSEEVEAASPQSEPQSPEVNAQFAAMRRRAEAEAERKFEARQAQMNAQIAAMCRGITHPTTGKPITTMEEYVDALAIQQRQANEQELQSKGVDPSMINRMIESNPVVMQAQRVIEQSKQTEAAAALQNDLAELSKIDPTIKSVEDLAALPTFPQMVDYINRYQGMSIIDAYKIFNYDHSKVAGRQQAINQMRGKDHLASQGTGVAQGEEYVEVPAEIMSRMKAEGKTEKQIRELYKTVANKLHIS